jgi:rubrerythrin
MNFLLWHQYFESNRNHFDHLDCTGASELSTQEKITIYSSIRQFQRGEHSEGKHFLKFAQSMNDESYVETTKIFIKEEQDHAAILGRFMELQGIDKLKKDWLDNCFRWLRKLARLEGTVTVLLTAEIISMIYYKALQQCTTNILLQKICKQILVDEEMHLQFQSFTLNILYRKKSGPAIIFSRMLHRILMSGTITMVWFYHKKVLRRGGLHFFSFFQAVWKEFKRCGKMIKDKKAAIPVSADVNHAA